MHVFLDQSDDAMYRIIILRWNNIDYAKTINLLSYIPFAVEILIVEDSSVNDNKKKIKKKNSDGINQNMFMI